LLLTLKATQLGYVIFNPINDRKDRMPLTP